jgi:hypothetical protein
LEKPVREGKDVGIKEYSRTLVVQVLLERAEIVRERLRKDLLAEHIRESKHHQGAQLERVTNIAWSGVGRKTPNDD